MLAIALTFDSFPCAALGCYGNEWIDTPNLDRLATEGFVFDAHVARSVDGSIPISESAAWWTGLADNGVSCHQLREVGARFRWDRAAWPEITRVEGRSGSDVLPRDWPFAKLLQAAREWLASSATRADRQLLWLHSAGIPLPCDVPAEVESLYIDEFADRGIDWSSLSDDERHRHPAVQAAYASCLDHFLGEFLEALTPFAASQPVLIVMSALFGGHWRPIPRRSEMPPQKEAQWLRSPSIWWSGPSPGGRKILPGRSPALVQPVDLGPTLLEWFAPGYDAAESRDVPARSGATRPGSFVSEGVSLWPLFDGTAQRVREAAFIDGGVLWTEQDVTVFTEPESLDPANIQHFLWPEDLWQVNDLASQTPEVVAERLQSFTDHAIQQEQQFERWRRENPDKSSEASR